MHYKILLCSQVAKRSYYPFSKEETRFKAPFPLTLKLFYVFHYTIAHAVFIPSFIYYDSPLLNPFDFLQKKKS